MTNKFKLIFVIPLCLIMVACAPTENNQERRTVKLGVVGEQNEEWEYVQDQLEENNEPVQLELVVFTEYIQPILALEDESIDLHSALTEIYMDSINKESGYSNTTIAYTTLNPMGLYSDKYQVIEDIPDESSIAIPNDVSNESRALLLMQTAGLIELNDEAGLLPSIDDITANPKKLEITPMAANQTARSLPDVAASAVNNDMAADAGFTPTEDAIFLEPVEESSEPYFNVIASRADETENEDYQTIIDYYQSPEVAEIIREVTNNSSIPVWEEQ